MANDLFSALIQSVQHAAGAAKQTANRAEHHVVNAGPSNGYAKVADHRGVFHDASSSTGYSYSNGHGLVQQQVAPVHNEMALNRGGQGQHRFGQALALLSLNPTTQPGYLPPAPSHAGPAPMQLFEMQAAPSHHSAAYNLGHESAPLAVDYLKALAAPADPLMVMHADTQAINSSPVGQDAYRVLRAPFDPSAMVQLDRQALGGAADLYRHHSGAVNHGAQQAGDFLQGLLGL